MLLKRREKQRQDEMNKLQAKKELLIILKAILLNINFCMKTI